jgi:hypothetical protein
VVRPEISLHLHKTEGIAVQLSGGFAVTIIYMERFCLKLIASIQVGFLPLIFHGFVAATKGEIRKSSIVPLKQTSFHNSQMGKMYPTTGKTMQLK